MRVKLTAFALIFLCRALSAADSVSIEKISYDETASHVNISCVVDSSLKVSGETLCVFQDGDLIRNIDIAPGNDRTQSVYLVFAFDSSKSISGKDMGKMKRTAGDFVSSSDNIQISIYNFDDSVVRLQPFTETKSVLVRTIDKIARSGKKTKLYDAILEGMKLLESTDSSGRQIIVFTDGKDEGSSVSSDDIISYSKSANIPINFYSIGQGKKNGSIQRIASLSGGSLISGDSSGKSLHSLFQQNPKKSYTVSYRVPHPKQGFHTVEVQLVAKNIRGKDISQYEYTAPLTTGMNIEWGMVAVVIVSILLLGVIIAVLLWRRKPTGGQYKETFRQRAVQFEEVPHDDRLGVLHQGLCRAWIMQKDGPERGKKFPLYWEETVIGRDKSCALSINDSRISPKHARIRFSKNSFYLIDLASDDGTFVNGRKLLRPKALNDWDEISLGQTMLIFRSTNDRV
jgi:hypothetical protein